MAKVIRPKPRKERKRVKGKVKLTQRARIVEKNNATRVEKPDTANYPRMQAQMPRSNGMVLKVKVKRK
jgi:hypothetical protein